MKFCFALSLGPLEHFVPLAQVADEYGWHAVSCSDHVVNPETTKSVYPYTEDGGRRWELYTPWPDPLVSFGALSAATTNLRFFTNVYILPLRTPFAVAKSLATAAVLSNNRIDFGVGMGWMEEEFEAMEQPFKRRGKRADEALVVIDKLMSGQLVEHHGEFYDFGPMEMNPVPTERVPIWVGGISDVALRRAARHDGWISDIQPTAELAEIRRTIDRHRAELGKENEPFSMVASATDAFTVDDYHRLEDVGVTHLLTMPWFFYSGFTEDLQERIDGVKRFSDEIISKY